MERHLAKEHLPAEQKRTLQKDLRADIKGLIKPAATAEPESSESVVKNTGGGFEVLTDSREIQATLFEGAHDNVNALFWAVGTKKPNLGFILEADYLRNALIVSFRSPEYVEGILRDLERTKNTHCFVSLALRRARVFFKVRVLGGYLNELAIAIPDRMFEVQRRRNTRLKIGDDEQLIMKLWFEDTPAKAPIHARLVDLSAHGAGLSVAPSKQKFFAPKSSIKKIVLEINQRKIQLTGEVRNTLKQKDRFRVGIEFHHVHSRDEQFLEFFVFERNRDYFLAWIASNDE